MSDRCDFSGRASGFEGFWSGVLRGTIAEVLESAGLDPYIHKQSVETAWLLESILCGRHGGNILGWAAHGKSIDTREVRWCRNLDKQPTPVRSKVSVDARVFALLYPLVAVQY